ncbi:F-box/FBD/LRR-repeat protein [Camellia lanceoleosa]|uniref:F-box/FBD/LRR-repeat protein n=1 Tax=Camellia lanceoleosa TaxID=1840588 RepID=A0ACC0HRH5_9ERIC|nr:F-box/FBD/LRR-repeat protein [Camellia lanceoleosa]
MLYIVPGKNFENLWQVRPINLSTFFLPKIVTLHFDGFFLKLLAAVPVPKRISINFNHLNDLVLDGLRFDDLDQVSCVLCLLRSSPNLRELYITVSAGGANGMESDLSYLEAPGCMDLMLNQLQTVNITSINGLRSELLFIKCVLASSPLLEKVIVQYDETVVDAKEGFRISTELMRFGRASPKAELVYVKP